MPETPSVPVDATPPTRTVLVVEDEPAINAAVTDRLRAEGLRVLQAFDGPGAVRMFDEQLDAEHPVDVVVLDVMLPGFDGHEVCRRIQATRPVPVLMVTARDEETDLLIGLGVGADDYLTKPFSMRELSARVSALLRRVDRAAQLAGNGSDRSATLELGPLSIDSASRRVLVDGAAVHLTPLEFDLLTLLAAQPGVVIGRDDLVQQVWGWADAGRTRTLDSHIRALRAKLGPALIRTVHGVGYALEVDS